MIYILIGLVVLIMSLVGWFVYQDYKSENGAYSQLTEGQKFLLLS